MSIFVQKNLWKPLACLLILAMLDGTGTVPSIAAEPPVASGAGHLRVQGELQALYEFSSPDGSIVKDRSGTGEPLDLRIRDQNAVRRHSNGLEIVSHVRIGSEKPATRIVQSIKQSGAITIEAWVHPAKTDQSGPARIVTLSRNSGERDFTLGQDGDKFEVRFRTTETSTNGIPAVTSKAKSLAAELTHVVYTRDRAGQSRIYINSKLNVQQTVRGETSNWDGGYQLALANEISDDRPWQGIYRLVAIYSRALRPNEIEQNFQAGAEAHTGAVPLVRADDSAKLFETSIARLLSKHCLECHDTLTKKGKLDLSRKAEALTGGDGGPAFVPGNSADSLLWTRVESNEMPHKRPPLSAEEKTLLRRWLDTGATWSLDVIDPVVYELGGGSSAVFVQRLTVPEYVESVRSVLGVDITKEAREILPRDLRADGFSNTAYNLNVDLGHVEAYAKLAEIIVGRIDIKALASRHTKSRELSDENLTKIITPVGRLLLRTPLSPEQIIAYCSVSTTVSAAGGNFEEAVRYILEAMLQSPRFLYRMESQRGDGHAVPLNQYELATRLSYILWGGPPDEELVQAADKGKLDRAGIEKQTKRMLRDRRAIDHSRQFIAEWLNLGRLENMRPSPQKFPRWNAALASDMREETMAYFENIAWKQNRPLADLLNAQVTFVTPRLAMHYGLPVDNSKKSANDELIRYDLTSVPSRGGLLTQGSVLTVGGDEASTVTRGLFVMHELLRGVVRNPPPCVNTTPVPSKPGVTKRAIAESRIANKSCTGCHTKFEPLSFGLEKFDGLGAFRETDEHGNTLRDDGNILFPGQDKPVSFQSSAELMNLLAGSDRVREAFTWKVAQFALGRPLGAEDAPIIAEIHRTAQQSGGTYTSLMTAIVLSDLVQTGRTEVTASTVPKTPTTTQ